MYLSMMRYDITQGQYGKNEAKLSYKDTLDLSSMGWDEKNAIFISFKKVVQGVSWSLDYEKTWMPLSSE